MAFQSAVAIFLGFGVVGDIFLDTPAKIDPAILNSVSAANNVFGRAFTYNADGTVAAGLGAGAANTVFAGILVNSKEHSTAGDANGALDPTLTLMNNEVAAFLKGGSPIVTLPATANIGDVVYFDNVTGVLGSMIASGTLPSGKTLIQGAMVDRYDTTGSSLAVLALNMTQAVKLS